MWIPLLVLLDLAPKMICSPRVGAPPFRGLPEGKGALGPLRDPFLLFLLRGEEEEVIASAYLLVR